MQDINISGTTFHTIVDWSREDNPQQSFSNTLQKFQMILKTGLLGLKKASYEREQESSYGNKSVEEKENIVKKDWLKEMRTHDRLITKGHSRIERIQNRYKWAPYVWFNTLEPYHKFNSPMYFVSENSISIIFNEHMLKRKVEVSGEGGEGLLRFRIAPPFFSRCSI